MNKCDFCSSPRQSPSTIETICEKTTPPKKANEDLYGLGKYAMRDLVQKLPSGNPQRDVGTSDDTIAAVLATLNEVIKKHPEFSRYRITSPFFLFLFSFFLSSFFLLFFLFFSSSFFLLLFLVLWILIRIRI